MIEVRPEPLDSDTAQALIAELNAELLSMYPPEQCFHELPAGDVAEGAGTFLVALADGEAIGCGAVRMLADGRAELKRMYVRPRARGRGISKAVLRALESHAATLNATSLVLETGDKQDAALGLYESAGYGRIPCFGAYAGSPSSICLEKPL